MLQIKLLELGFEIWDTEKFKAEDRGDKEFEGGWGAANFGLDENSEAGESEGGCSFYESLGEDQGF